MTKNIVGIGIGITILATWKILSKIKKERNPAAKEDEVTTTKESPERFTTTHIYKHKDGSYLAADGIEWGTLKDGTIKKMSIDLVDPSANYEKIVVAKDSGNPYVEIDGKCFKLTDDRRYFMLAKGSRDV